MCFEFDLEVRPEFDLPKWKGLKLKKPVREFTAEDVERSLEKLLANRGRLVPLRRAGRGGRLHLHEPALRVRGPGACQRHEEVIRIRPMLSFRDGKIEEFDKLMAGVRGGETRTRRGPLTEDAPNAALRGQRVTAIFEVLEVKRLEKPELTAEFLDELGGFTLGGRSPRRHEGRPGRRLEYRQRQEARKQITAALTVAAGWELPPELLQRQSQRELQRAVMDMQSSGFTDDEIRAHENVLRQNSRLATARR